MSDITVSVVNQTVTVSPSTQALTVTVPYSNTATISSLDDLSDVSVGVAISGNILRHNGSYWVNTPGTTYFAAASHTHAQADVTGLVLFVSNTNTTLTDQADLISQAQFDISNLQSAYPALSSLSSVRTSTLSITSSWLTMGDLTLTAGTWLVQSTCTAQHSTGTALVATKLATAATGGTIYASTEARTAASNKNLSISCQAIVTVSSSTTVSHYVTSDAASGGTVQYQTSIASGALASGATQITAVRIA